MYPVSDTKLNNEMKKLQTQLCEYTAKSLSQLQPEGNAQEMKLVVEAVTKLMNFVEKAKPKANDGKRKRQTPSTPDPMTAIDAFAALDQIKTAREQNVE
jgi:flagellar capping protein FliD